MSEEIRDAVGVLIEKMNSEPYAFVQGGRFAWVAAQLTSQEDYLASMINPSELSALKEAFKGVLYTMFRDRVFKCLLGEPELGDPTHRTLRPDPLAPVKGGWVNPNIIYGGGQSKE